MMKTTKTSSWRRAALAFAAVAVISSPVRADSDASSEADITRSVLPVESIRDTRFRFLDLDGDGFLSGDEIGEDDSVLRSQFDSLDADRDGRLSKDEYALFSDPR